MNVQFPFITLNKNTNYKLDFNIERVLSVTEEINNLHFSLIISHNEDGFIGSAVLPDGNTFPKGTDLTSFRGDILFTTGQNVKHSGYTMVVSGDYPLYTLSQHGLLYLNLYQLT